MKLYWLDMIKLAVNTGYGTVDWFFFVSSRNFKFIKDKHSSSSDHGNIDHMGFVSSKYLFMKIHFKDEKTLVGTNKNKADVLTKVLGNNKIDDSREHLSVPCRNGFAKLRP